MASLQDRSNGLCRFWGSTSAPDPIVFTPRRSGKSIVIQQAVAEARMQGKTVHVVPANETPEETVRRLSRMMAGGKR